jgi:hypothetical protein
LAYWAGIFARWGITGELIGTTPYVVLPGSDIPFDTPRGAEIEACLDEFGHIGPFVILDDDTDV